MISDKMRAAACKAINDLGKGNNVSIPDINAMLNAAIAAAEPIGIRCTGCGMPWDDDRLAAERAKRPGLISCCPERKMVPVYDAPTIDAKSVIEMIEDCVLFSSPAEYVGLADWACFEAGQDNAVKTIVSLLRDSLAVASKPKSDECRTVGKMSEKSRTAPIKNPKIQ